MSNVDPTVPVYGTPTTQSVRDNFAIIRAELESLELRSTTLATSIEQTFGYSDGPATFTLRSGVTYIPSSGSLAVYLDGWRLILGTNWTETSSNSFTLDPPISVGQEVLAVIGQAVSAPLASTGVLYDMGVVGSTVRTAKSIFDEHVSVLNFAGVDPTGVADSLASITAAQVASDIIYFPLGVYSVADDLAISKTFIMEPGATIKPTTGKTVSFTATGRVIANLAWKDTSGGGAFTANVNDELLIVGRGATVSAAYASALGYEAVATVVGGVTQAGAKIATAGDAQTTTVVSKVQTTDATATSLTLADGTSVFVMPNDSTWGFVAYVAARRTDVDGESALYKLEGCIDRNANAASTALVGSVTKTVVAEDTAAWDVSASASTSTGGLQIQVTGEAAKTINWVARVEFVEVIG